MYGVVSLLDEEHNAKVERIWAELHERFGVHGDSITPIAHFSYHVAGKYHREKLTDRIRQIARHLRPFTVITNGLGIFTGHNPVLHVNVARQANLMAVHQQIWDRLQDVGEGIVNYYNPGLWQPHITLTHGDVNHDLLPKVVRLLSERDFNWEITIDNLAVIGGDNVHGIVSRAAFGG